RVRLTQVVHLVRNAGLDVDEIAGAVLHHLGETLAIGVAHPALEDVEHHLEIDVDVGIGDRARGNRRHVHREPGRPDVGPGETGQVLNSVPGPTGRTMTKNVDPLPMLGGGNRGLLGHSSGLRQCVENSPESNPGYITFMIQSPTRYPTAATPSPTT